MIARQADPRWVQGFLGHSKLTTTERYLHAKSRPEDVELLNRAFAFGAGRVGLDEDAPAADERPVVAVTPAVVREWDRHVNTEPVPNADPNRNVLAGAGGRPATAEEILAFARENDARIARERCGR